MAIETLQPRSLKWQALLKLALRSLWTGPLTSSSPEIARLLGDLQPNASGVSVNADTALNFSAFWAAVNTIASDVGSLPLIVYQRLPDGGKRRYENSPLYKLLRDEPNPEMGAMVFRETIQSHVLTTGNGYAEIERDRSGRPLALWPITPVRVTPKRYGTNGELAYDVQNPDGTFARIEAANMLHIPGLGYDGVIGYSVVNRARESIGLGLATERFGASFFGNGSTFGGIVTHPKTLSPDAKANIEKSIEARHSGLSRAHRIMVLEEAMTFAATGVNPDDAQFLETRKFQVTEIARWFTIPPHKLGDLEKATFSNIEHLSIDYVLSTLRRWLIRWEQEINRKLIRPLERNQQFVEHLMDALLRGDTQSRYAAYAVGRQWGWLSPDDIREKENLNPLPDDQGSIYLVPANMFSAKAYVDNPTPSSTPPPAAPQPADDQQARTLRELLAVAEDRYDRARQTLDVMTAEHSAAIARADELSLRSDATGEQIREAIKATQTAQATVLMLTEQVDARDRDLTTAREQLTAAQAINVEVSVDLDRASAALTQAEADRELARSEADRLRDQIRDGEVELAGTRARAELLAAVADRAEAEALAVSQDYASNLIARATAEQEAVEAREAANAAQMDIGLVQLDIEAARTAEAEAVKRERDLTLEAAEFQQDIERLTADRDAVAGQLAIVDASRIAAEAEARAAIVAVANNEAELEAARLDADVVRQRLHDVEHAAMASLQEAKDAIRAERNKRLRNAAAVLTAHRSLFQDAVRRMIERETDRARRAQGTPEKLRDWAERFYPSHEETCFRTFVPAMRVHAAWIGQTDAEADTRARVLAAEHVQESRRQMAAVVEGDADAIGESLYSLFARWEADRAAAVADRLFAEEFEFLHNEGNQHAEG